MVLFVFFFSSRRRHTRSLRDWSSDVCSRSNLTDFLSQLIHKLGPPIKVYKLKLDQSGGVDLWVQDQGRHDLIDSYEYEHRSEERRVGKECRSRRTQNQE